MDGREFAGLVFTALQEGLLLPIDPIDFPDKESPPHQTTDTNVLLPIHARAVEALVRALKDESIHSGL